MARAIDGREAGLKIVRTWTHGRNLSGSPLFKRLVVAVDFLCRRDLCLVSGERASFIIVPSTNHSNQP